MRKLATMRAALADPALLGDALPGDSWSAWRTLLIAAMGEALNETERPIFTKLTGREREPGGDVPVEILLVVAGRRSGKTKAMGLLSVYLSCLVDWSADLSLGERGLALYLSPTERQAGIAFGYSAAVVDHVALLRERIESRTASSLALKGSIDMETQPASWRHSRGGTSVCICLDECAFFHSAEESANRDADLLSALRPSLATTGGPCLLTSSPATTEGIVHTIHKRHFGPDGDPKILVVQSDTATLNPSIRKGVIERAFADDPTSAAAEWGGEFRAPTAVYLERAIVERAVTPGIPSRVLAAGVRCLGFVDVAGGSGSDSFCLAIGHVFRDHNKGDVAIVDALFEAKPPFDPDEVTAQAAALLRASNVFEVVGDAYGGGWPIVSFARHGIKYTQSALTKSELYLHVLPLFMANRVKLVDQPRLVDQFCGLRRRVGQGGRESVDHMRGGHDDLANSVAGLLWRLSPVMPAVKHVPAMLFHPGGQFERMPGTALGGGEWVSRWVGGPIVRREVAERGVVAAPGLYPPAAWTAEHGYRDVERTGAARFDNTGGS